MEERKEEYPKYPEYYQEEEIDLREYLRIIIKRRWLIGTVFFILVTVAAIYSFLADPVYKATCSVLIEKENPKVVDVEEVLGVNTTGRDYYQTQYEILKSRSLALRVIKKLDLEHNPEFIPKPPTFFGRLINWIKSLFSSEEKKLPDSKYNRLIDTYLKKLKIEPVRNSRIVKVSFLSKDPVLAAKVANTHAQLYIESNIERKFEASRKAVEWLKKRIKEVREKLKAAELALQRYREKEGLASVDFEERQSIILKSLDELTTALNKAKAERIKKETLYRELVKIANNPEKIDSLPEVVQNPLIQRLKEEYIKLVAEYYKMGKKYGPEHPVMVRLRSEINAIKKNIVQEVKKIAESIKIEYQIALENEKEILKEMEKKKKEALELNKKQIQYNVLKREVDVNRSLYESLLKRLKETGITEDLRMTNIMIVDPAKVPDKPVKPKKKLNIIVAGFTGIFLGVFLSFFLEYLDNTVKYPSDVERKLNSPLLGIVGRSSDSEGELVVGSDSKSHIAESFRTIRTNLSFTLPDVEKKVFLISSALPSEGKTFICANLSAAFSQIGKKVLLIDCDLRKPRIHRIFEIEREDGLSEFLSGSNSNVNLKNSKFENLRIITSGIHPPNPSELLASQKMKKLIEDMRKEFDIIIIDSPPVLSASDSLEIAPITDGVVMVVKAGSTPIPSVQTAMTQISDVGAKIIGCILNNVDFQKEDYYYSYYRYYHHYYYYYEDGRKKKRRAY